MTSSLSKKVRCRFLDRSTGNPVPGVVASLAVTVGDPPNLIQFPVSTLCSDATGYMSFDLKAITELEFELGLPIQGFVISAPKFGLTNYDLLGSLIPLPPGGAENAHGGVIGSHASRVSGQMMSYEATTNGEGNALAYIVFPIYLDNHLQDGQAQESGNYVSPHFPSIQSPDIWDYSASPYSFVTPPSLKLDSDGCEVLLPSSLPVQQYSFNKVVVHQDNIMLPLVPTKPRATPQVSVTAPLNAPDTAIKFGEVLEYRQDWYSLGHSLGEIKYSLPLAPGESTQLAVIEWSRDDFASRTDDIRATEFLNHDSRRDRAIEDTVDTALWEQQGGNSHMGSTSGTGGGNWGVPGVWGAGVTGNHAFGGGISYSYGDRTVEGESLQDLHDRVYQASASVRSLNGTVIVQASQTEKNMLQTRRVANHNHCHALTIQYYEVLRHYRLTTTFSGRRRAVLIPFTLFLFDLNAILRFRNVLEQTLLDPTLSDCFDAMVRLYLAPSVYDAPKLEGPASGGSTTTVTVKKTATIEVKGTKETGENSGIPLKKDDKFLISASLRLAVSAGPFGYGSGGFPPEGDGQDAPTGGDFPFIAPGLKAFSLIYKVGLFDTWHQGTSNEELIALHDGDLIFAVNQYTRHFADYLNNNAKFWNVDLEYPSHKTETTPPTDPSKDTTSKKEVFRKSDDLLCEARLLAHLNGNQGYYNSAVWMLLNPVERRVYLEAALKERPEILYGMDDKPIAVSGNYVAFPYNGALAGWVDKWESDPKKPIRDIVTLPTRGLFAEAQLGHCNSCEQRDVTRMWDWTEMTTETPPEIVPVSQGPKGQAPSITQGQLPGNVIQITTPQAAPDPTGLANALNVLKTPDIFRDMAGLDEVSQLLGELARSSGDAYTKGLATLAQQKVAQTKATMGSSGASPKQTPGERYDNLQVAKEVANSADQLGLSDKELADLTKAIIGGGRPLLASADAGFVPDTETVGTRIDAMVITAIGTNARLKESYDSLIGDGWELKRKNIFFGNSEVDTNHKTLFIDDDDEPINTLMNWITDSIQKAYQADEDYRRRTIRDKAIKIFGGSGLTDLEKMALAYGWAGWFWQYPSNEGNAKSLLDDMMLVFTELEPNGIEANDKTHYIFSAGRSRAYSTGFKYKFRDDGNQVRHATGSIQASFSYGLAGLAVMQSRETSDSADHRLNSVCNDIGSNLKASVWKAKDIADILRRELGDPLQTGPWTGPPDGDPNPP